MQVTMTIGGSIPEALPVPTVLKLKAENPKHSTPAIVAALIKQLQEMEIFGLQEQAQISAWAKESLPLFTTDDKVSEKLEALIQLAAEIVEPKFLVEAPEEAQLTLLRIDDKIKGLMKEYLPSGISSEAMIAAHQPKSMKAHKVVEKKITNQISLGEKLSAVLEQMIKSPFFSNQEKMQVAIWVNTLPPQFFDMLKDEKTSELASIGLSYLLCKVLYPALLRANEEMEKMALSSMYKELKEVLRLSLPEGKNPDEFLKTYQSLSMKAEIFSQKELITKECVKVARNKLCVEANAVSDKIANNAEKNKLHLLELSASHRLIANAPNDKIRPLTDKTGLTIEKMKGNENQMISLADKLEACHLQFQKNTHSCQEVLKKI